MMERALAQATKSVDKDEHKVKPEEREGSATGSVDGNGSAARFDNPAGVAVDGSGNLYVVDNSNNRVQKFEIDLN